MIESFRISSNLCCYYDLERKTIARFPTNSNLFQNGSDNSLYFGMISNKDACKIFCKLFDAKKIEHLVGKKILMACGENDVEIVFNINAQGQIQLKLCKNGIMFKLANDYSYLCAQSYDFTKMLIVLDFKNCQIRFRNPDDLVL